MGTRPIQPARPPYRILAIGEFARFARRAKSSIFTLTQANFAETLRNLDISVEVPDPTADAKSKRQVTVPVSALTDFAPLRMAPNVPYMAPLAQARDVVVATQNNSLTMDQCRSALTAQSTNPELRALLPDGLVSRIHSDAAPTKPNDKLDSLFDLVEAEPPPPSKADALIADVLGTSNRGHATGKDRDLLDAALRRIDLRLAEMADTLLAQPALRKTESAWRGLAELVRHLPRDGSVELRAIDSEDSSALDTLAALLESSDDDMLPSLVLLDQALGNTPPEIAWLDSLSRHAETYQLPCIVSLSASFFGEEDTARLGRSEALANRFDTPKFELWNALRAKDRARWAVCAYNRFLQRAAHAASAARPTNLWGAPGWLVAALVIRSVGTRQWPTQIYQPGGEQIEDLPLHQFVTPAGDESAMPLEQRIDDTLCNDLSLQGILPLQCVANRDRVFITRAPSLLRPRRYSDASVNVQSQIMSSFPYQMLTARVAQLIQCNRTLLLGDRHPAQVSERLENYLTGLVRDSGRGAKVEVQIMADPDNPSRMMATVSIQMGRDILSGADIELTFAM